MTDHERTVTAALVAVASLVLIAVGVLLDHAVPLAGFVLIALGGLGAVQAVLIGLGVMRVGEQNRKRDP